MTRKELSQIYYLDKELKRCEENLAEIRASIQAKTQKITGMPHQNNGGNSNEVEETVFRLLKAEQAVDGYQQAILIRKARILEWLSGLDDILLVQIVDYRCLKLLTWEEVAARVGGGNTAESVRKHFVRNIEKSEGCPQCPIAIV